MGIDPIKPVGKPGEVRGTQAASEVAGIKPTEGNFRINQVGDVANVGAVSPPAVGDDFARLKVLIAAGVSKRMDTDAIIHDLIEHESSRIFGQMATPAMKASVAERFKSDPSLRTLISKLLHASASS